MKRLVLSLLSIMFLYISCNSKSVQKEEEPIPVETTVIKDIDTPDMTEIDTTKMTGVPIKINTEEFIKNIHDFNANSIWQYKGTIPCIVDFYADWCRPCKMMDPILEKLAKEYKGKLIIYKINIDQNKDIARAFAVNSIPFFLFCPVNGQPQSGMGMMSEDDMRNAIESILK